MNEDDVVDTLADPDLPLACECDNTHQAVDTVCRWCYAHGRRHWNDPEVVGMQKCVLLETIIDPTGDSDLHVPAGTVVYIEDNSPFVQGDLIDVRTDDGRVFPVEVELVWRL